MPLESAAAVADALGHAQILDDGRLGELTRDLPRFADAAALLRELVRRGWLTPYQANRVRAGRACELLLGRYVVLDALGEGGMGQVLKVWHRDLDRVQALKLIRPSLLDSPQALQRFQREARAAARLSHPNVVLVFDGGVLEASGTPFLALEYVEGTDLHRLVGQSGPLPAGRACDYARQAALGLQHAHDKGLVHRDVKPGNLLLAASSPLSSRLIKVGDFGLASVCGGGGGRSGPLTAEGAVVGTPDYMAPEQALRAHAIDGRADVYSLGCTLAFLLTGRPPFPDGSAAQKLLAHQQSEPPDLAQLRPDLPAELGSVVRRLLAKRPEDRYQSPAEAAAALVPFCGGTEQPLASPSTISDMPPPATREESSPPPQRRRRVLAGLLAGALLAAVLVFVLVRVLSPRHEGGGEPSPGDNPASPLDGLRSEDIAEVERLEGLPPEVVAVFGTRRWRHWGRVNCIALSPDGRTLASGGYDQVIRLWDVTPDGPVPRDRVLRGHGDNVTSLAFSPDGRTLATGSDDRTVRLWDVATGQSLATLKERGTQQVYAVAFGRDGTLASAGEDRLVRLWKVAGDRASATVEHVLRGHEKEVQALAFSPDGKVLVAGDGAGAIKRWELAGDKVSEPKPLAGTGGDVLCLAFDPQGKWLAAGGKGPGLRIWDKEWQLREQWQDEDEGPVQALAFSPDGKTLARGTINNFEVKLWDVAGDGKVRRRDSSCAHFGHVLALAFKPGDTRTLFSGGQDGVIRRWDLTTKKEPGTGPGHGAQVEAVAFSPDGRLLASAGDYAVRL
jgi:serine/threonine protein kinase/WD40 repeat protein